MCSVDLCFRDELVDLTLVASLLACMSFSRSATSDSTTLQIHKQTGRL